ncbi:hypothetical protein [Acinetobacter piscicola]|uniref:hypothetical protein n=1 Tax=Acinetobacter piscicola TaxID=2006115 RepID=UPI000B7E813A|nr:hypothetical protein [Acinetobacter piscicola]
MIDYSIFYNSTLDINNLHTDLPSFDIFISAYNLSERVKSLFTQINATQKYWLVHPEYHFTKDKLPIPNDFEIISPSATHEKDQVSALIDRMGDINNKTICIDITGFMRHVLIFLIAMLKYKGVVKFTAIYSEPRSYSKAKDTEFGATTEIVRPISGISQTANSEYTDHLIINIGYDHKMVSQVVSYKDGATFHPLFSFPSLSADMYQQSAMRAALSGSITQHTDWITKRRFSPANNPFATAQVLSDIVNELDQKNENKNNIYLAPISTKAQTLGFAIYWALEGENRGITILLPECINYSVETSIGLKRLWVYEVELFV